LWIKDLQFVKVAVIASNELEKLKAFLAPMKSTYRLKGRYQRSTNMDISIALIRFLDFNQDVSSTGTVRMIYHEDE
jgi:hypothetical protein